MSRVLIWGVTEELIAHENELDWSVVRGIIKTDNTSVEGDFHGFQLVSKDGIEACKADYLLIMDEGDLTYKAYMDSNHWISREYLSKISFPLEDACFPPIYNYVNSNIYAMGARSVLDIDNVTIVHGNKTPNIYWPSYKLLCNRSRLDYPFYVENLYDGDESVVAECAMLLDPFYHYNIDDFLEMLRRDYSSYRYVAFNLPLDYAYPENLKQWHDLPVHELGQVFVVDNPLCGLFCMWEPGQVAVSKVHMHIITHKDCEMPPLDDCYDKLFVGGVCDSVDPSNHRECTGDNIAQYNAYINENTGIYWAWKNDVDCDYIGFCHYRRFFTSDDITMTERHILQQFEIEHYMKQYDMIVAGAHIDQGMTLEERFSKTIDIEAYREGMEIVRRVVAEAQPEYMDAFEHVFGGHSFFPCNMFVMPRMIFDQYCQWLFSILPKACEQFHLEKYDNYSCRAIGFIAERMLTVWLMKQEYRVKELPIQQIEL